MSDKHSRRQLQSSSVTTVVSISLVLCLLGLLGWLILNAQKLSDHVKETIGFQVILKENAREADIIRLQKKLDASHYVKSTEYITQEMAEQRFKENVDPNENFTRFLDGYNPLPASIDVRLLAEYANPDSVKWIEKDILANETAEEIWYQKSLLEQVNKNIKNIGLGILVVSGVLLFIALALINNTIRLSIYSKRFLIKTMQLVGATQGFIRRPFFLSGITHGLYGAIIAIGLITALLYFLERLIPDFIQLKDLEMLLTLYGIIVLLGIIITGISTSLAVRKYLRSRTEQLYG